MTPKFRGVSSALSKLQHALDSDAEKLINRISRADERREAVFKKSHESVSAAEQSLDDIEKFIGELEGSNGGPSMSSDEESGEKAPRSSEVASR